MKTLICCKPSIHGCGIVKTKYDREVVVMDIDRYGNVYPKWVSQEESKKAKYRPENVQKRLEKYR